MTIKKIDLPLDKSSANYFFTVPLEGESYRVSLYYNERSSQWIFNLSNINEDPLVLGAGVVFSYPMLYDYGIPGLSGFFWFEPIGKTQNQTIDNPFEIWKYYTLSYYYDDGEVDDS